VWKTLLTLSVALYLILSVLYWLVIPTGESPDEPGHLQCIEQVAEYGRVPITEPGPVGEWWGPGVILSGRMCYHMPLYYLMAGVLQKSIAWATDSPVHFDFPEHNPEFGSSGIMFQHQASEHIWQISEPVSLSIVRLLSVLLGLVTLFAAYQVAAQVFPERPAVPVLATALVSGWPQFVFLSRSINNDVLATALAAALLAVLLRVGLPRRFPLAALLAAGAVAAKLSMAFTVIVVLLSWSLEFWSFSDERWRYVRAFMLSIGIWILVFGSLLLNPTVRLHLLGSSWYWTQQAGSTFALSYWLDVAALMIDSGWARFGWMNVVVPPWQAYLWWMLIAATAVLGFVSAWRTCRLRADLIRLIMVLLWMAGIAMSIVRINLVVFQPQFRFALSSLPLFAGFASGGILSTLPSLERVQVAAVAATLVILLVANLWIIGSVLYPLYL
jgi:hypothetical protein